MDDHTRDPSVPPPLGNPTGWVRNPSGRGGYWEHATLRRAVGHGVRLFNDGAYHEAHDCFEHEWYNYGAGTTESAFLHGMVQVAAGALKHHTGDDGGMDALFETAFEYLAGVPPDYYGVDVVEVREQIDAARANPPAIEEWSIALDDERPTAREDDYAHVEAIESGP